MRKGSFPLAHDLDLARALLIAKGIKSKIMIRSKTGETGGLLQLDWGNKALLR